MIGVVSFEEKARINPADYDWVVDFWLRPYPVYYDNTNKVFRRMTDNTSQQFAGLMMWLTNCNNDYGIVIFDWLVQIKAIAWQTPFFTSATRYYLGSDWNLTTTVTDIYIWKSVVDALDWSNNYNFLIEIEPNIPYWYVTATNYQKAINQVVDFTQTLDNNVVHKTTNENIAGIKTFSDRPVFQNWINLLDVNHKIYTTWWQGIYIEPFGTDRPLHIQQSTGKVELRNKFMKRTPTDQWYANSFRIGTRYENSGITHWNMGHITQILRWDLTDANAEWSGNDWGRGLQFWSTWNPYLKFIAVNTQIWYLWWTTTHRSNGQFDRINIFGDNTALIEPRVKNVWFSDTVPIEERWDGAWNVRTRIWRMANNIMYMSQANFWWLYFEFRWNYNFTNNIKINWKIPALQDAENSFSWYRNYFIPNSENYAIWLRYNQAWTTAWIGANSTGDFIYSNARWTEILKVWQNWTLTVNWQNWTTSTNWTPTAFWQSWSWATMNVAFARYCEKWDMAWVSIRATITSKWTCSWIFYITSPTTVNLQPAVLSWWIYANNTWPNSSKWRANCTTNAFNFTKASANSNTLRSDIAINDEILIQWRYLK